MALGAHKPDPVGDYMAAARDRLAADGNELSSRAFTYGRALVARHASTHFLMSVDLFTMMVPVTRQVTPDLFVQFIADATLHARVERGGTTVTRGLSVLPIMVADEVTPEARADALARTPSKVGVARYNGGTFRWPAVVDVGTGEHLYYGGSFWIGRFGSEWIREKLLGAMGPLPVAR